MKLIKSKLYITLYINDESPSTASSWGCSRTGELVLDQLWFAFEDRCRYICRETQQTLRLLLHQAYWYLLFLSVDSELALRALVGLEQHLCSLLLQVEVHVTRTDSSLGWSVAQRMLLSLSFSHWFSLLSAWWASTDDCLSDLGTWICQ